MLFVNLSWKETNKDDDFVKSRGRGVNWLMLGILAIERKRKGKKRTMVLGILTECCLYLKFMSLFISGTNWDYRKLKTMLILS